MALFNRRKKKLELKANINSDLKAIKDVRQLICESTFSNPEVTRQMFLRMNEIHERILYTIEKSL